MVTLAATPNGSSLFTSWAGACTGSGTCVVTMDQARSVTASFSLQSYGLSVTKAGNGAALGSVTSTPAGINCGTDCSEAYAANTTVMLTAAAMTGATFTGWSGGGCTGTSTCSVTIGAVVGVTATFTLVQATLTVARAGNGTGAVTSNPTGINCGTTCTQAVDYSGMVTLTAMPAAGSSFSGWSGGGCTGNGTCVVTVTAATTVTATFALNQYALNVTRAGAGTGTVTSAPTGINCGPTCSAMFNHGTMVTLTAAADTNADFGGWSGGACTGTGACTVTMDQARNVTATFTPKARTLTVTRTGDGTGTMTVNPGGAVCSASSCAYTIPHGTSVSLTAAAGGGSLFDGWSGAGCTSGACTFTIMANTTVSAQFTLANRTLTVDFAGTATGSVVVMPTGTTLSATGNVTIPTHANVTIVATPAANMGFAGWGGPCTGFDDCTFAMEANTTVTVHFDPPNKAFVTSITVTPGLLGGLAGADTICAQRATAGSLTGTFRAFLGSSSGTAWSRISSARGWARTDGKPFGDSATDLQAGRTFYPLIRTESNVEIPFAQTLVVTGAQGGAGAPTCSNWTSTSGGDFDVGWGDPWSGYLTYAGNGSTSCNTTTRMYCFETTRSVRLRPPTPATARRAFVSASGVTGSVTLAGADAQCQNEATTAGLTGTYRALLAGNGTSAASRFTVTGGSAPWYRADNVQLAATAASYLAAGTIPWAALSLRADGVTQQQDLVFTGAADPSALGTAAGTCGGWASTSGSNAVVTYGNFVTPTWFGPFMSGACNQTQHVFCLQQ
jgi:trimeric autotransporter adhesin